ncbi:MAG: oxidoreductase [Actinomycetales bacterium]|nr:MAG: oxidoreductase [Actinomycetales bacterium]
MKQVAQNYRSGDLVLLDVPAPACLPGGVLVRTVHSLISTGTEMMKVGEARLSLLGKARARPDQVKKVLDSVAQQGPVAAYQKAMNKLDSYTPLGYSLCGEVVEVGAGVSEFSVGDIVACAGNEFALHAEVNWVPTNLCVRVPEGVSSEHAAFATVGAIAMQGVRQGEVQLGELACVVGLGLIGQIVVRLLTAAGVRVVGVDTVESRCRLAEQGGAIVAHGPDEDGVQKLTNAIDAATDGMGADHVFLAAGGNSNGPVELAARISRDRGRIVDIGKTKLDLPWNDYYEKELDVRFSRSYGPGRYDDEYELKGRDYPIGYVRWTERRNLACFLDLLSSGSIDISALLSSIESIDDAVRVYERIRTGELAGVGFVFSYPPGPPALSATNAVEGGETQSAVHTPPVVRRGSATDKVRVGFIGAGNYASSMLLPHLAKNQRVELAAVATTKSLSSANAQTKFGFQRATTDSQELLKDDSLDVVFVVTRHDSHAQFVADALRAGKAVFVEKPLAVSEEQLQLVLDAIAETGNDRVMVGFNRRFSPLLSGMRRRFGSVDSPLTLRYLVNAGRLDSTSWYLDTAEQGSRFVGEGGHFIDTLSFWVGRDPLRVFAEGTGDDSTMNVSLHYPDGSLATITYATAGDSRFPKETLDVTGGGRNARMDNFTKATVWSRGKDTKRSVLGQDKGQQEQLRQFVDAIATGAPMPISCESLIATTRATIAAGESLARGELIRL